MSQLYHHADYPKALDKFKQSSSDRKWSEFKKVQLKVANYKCPICECSLKDGNFFSRINNQGSTHIIEATVDHYRPQKHYDFLTFEPENYILMCSECNNIYKGCHFPLLDDADRATKKEDLVLEKPLIVSPINDNLLDLFNLIFKYTTSGRKILELQAKQQQGYLYEKTVTTIGLFSLGSCDTTGHYNENIRNCRINLLSDHYKKFKGFIDALNARNIAQMRIEIKKYDLDSYGFFKFIIKKQFKDLSS